MATPRAVTHPRAWRGEDQARRTDWVVRLTELEIEELERAARRLSGRPLDDLTRSDFPLPTLASKLSAVERELAEGRGFVLLRGIPRDRYSEQELATMFWGVGTHLGIGVSQSAEGDRMGHVFDRGLPTERYYTRGGPLEFHMDPVDVVGLLCVSRARAGGESRIVSALAVHNVVLAERPDMLERLYRGFRYSRRAHGEPVTAAPVPVFAEGAGRVDCYYLPSSIRQIEGEGLKLSAGDWEAMDYIESVAHRPGLYLDMEFEEGDIQFLNNRAILHARTDYTEDPDPARKRHLLRLWLMMPHWPARLPEQTLYSVVDRAGGGVAPARTAS